MLGTTEIIIIGGIVVLMFGATKLPKLGGAIGESIKNFKKGVADNEPKALNEDNNQSSDSKDSGSKQS